MGLRQLFVVFLIMLPGTTLADDVDRIRFLLDRVKASECSFIRNGTEYSASKAEQHLAMKYERVKSRITTVEAFIERIASRSSISGRPYTVRCPHGEKDSGEWLREELNKYQMDPSSPAKSN